MIETTIASPWPRADTTRRDALDRAYTELYPDLCRIARARLRLSEQRDLDSHSLVHESFLRLVSASAPPISNTQHFCAYAAKTMQNIAIDVAREQAADRRGGRFESISLDSDGGEPVPDGPAPQRAGIRQRIHDALLALEAADGTLARVVRMRYFDGYSEREIAAKIGTSRRTVRRQWGRARELLHSLLQE
jgi:RNA polymerase sigma factor (TIGR02999 family)